MIHAVLFDAAGTLIRPDPSVGAVYARAWPPLAAHVDAARLEHAFRAVWERRRGSTGAAALLAAGADPVATRNWWRGIVRRVLDEVGFAGDREACFDACYEAFARPDAWSVFEDARPTLRALRRRNLVLAVVSNWDYRLPRLLAGLGLAGAFDHLLISALEGVAKPDGEIFRRACARAGCGPQEAIHVGDRADLDVEGARSAGLHALLLDRHATVSSAGVIRSLLEVVQRLPPLQREQR